jgi:hypothetical protein
MLHPSYVLLMPAIISPRKEQVTYNFRKGNTAKIRRKRWWKRAKGKTDLVPVPDTDLILGESLTRQCKKQQHENDSKEKQQKLLLQP